MEVLQSAGAVAFLAVAALAVRLWWRHRSVPSAWLAWTFVVLAAGIVSSRLAATLPDGLAADSARWLARVGIVAFPYLLFRFVATFQPVDRRVLRAGGVLAGAVLAATAVLPVPTVEGPAPARYTGYVLVVLLVWSGLSSWAVWRLWRSGQRQPTVARRRMRTLAVAAAVLNAALIMAGFSTTAGGPAMLTAAIQSAGLLSAVLFYVGFAPPPLLRQMWRRADERKLWAAEGELMAATSGSEVVTSMLPYFSRLLGGGAAAFVDRGGRATMHGTVPKRLLTHLREEADPEAAATRDVLVVDLQEGRLGIVVSPATPLFGREELELLRWLGTLMDLAAHRAELYDREQQARARAEVLAGELEALVYGLSHDLRSPVVSALGYVECLAEDYGDLLSGDGTHFLERLRANVEYMDELVGDLLSLSRVGRVDETPEPVDLSALVEHVAGELRREHRQATIDVDSLPVVHMDRPRARQLFTNLIANALLHGGRPDVTVRVRAVGQAENGQACVSVSDNGRGIAEPDRHRVFGLFERLDGGGKGTQSTGIGLAMCRRIVEHAGGQIWIADSDAGADVRVALPLATPGVPERMEEIG